MVMLVPFVSLLFGLVSAPEVCPQLSLSKDAIVGWTAFQLNSIKQSEGFLMCLFYISIGFIGLTFLSNLCRYLAFFFLAPIRNGVLKDIRNDIYNKLTLLPIAFFNKNKSGDLISRVTTDVSTIEWSVMTCLQMVVKDPVMIIVFLIALLVASWQFVIIIIVVLPLPLFLIKKIGASLNRNSTKVQNHSGILLSKVEEALYTNKITKSLNAEQIVQDNFHRQNNVYTKILNKVVARTELAGPITEYFSIIILALVVIGGGILVINQLMHPATLIAFTIIFSRIISPIKELITAYYNFQKGEAAATRIYEILNAKQTIVNSPQVVECKSFSDSIVFENVSFQYDDSNQQALKNVNLCVKKGMKIAIVGASGSGKSTLMDLIIRFQDPTSGKIYFDGKDLREFDIASLRRRFSLVTQESFLFNDTIKANISFSKPNASMEEIQQVAKATCADEFIEHLPQKYNTICADRGLSLSGGQRQRICIARALLSDSDILLLDEATSAMDTQNEKKISQAINNIAKQKTLIIIAHRLNTIVDSDLIVVLDKGQVVEMGNHQQLLNNQGLYCKLIKMQKL